MRKEKSRNPSDFYFFLFNVEFDTKKDLATFVTNKHGTMPVDGKHQAKFTSGMRDLMWANAECNLIRANREQNLTPTNGASDIAPTNSEQNLTKKVETIAISTFFVCKLSIYRVHMPTDAQKRFENQLSLAPFLI